MGPRPWKPAVELEGALDRGDLAYAITLAREVSEQRPLSLDLALRFLPLVAVERTDEFSGWAIRWFARWLSESAGATIEQAAELAAGATIEQAAELAATLADLPSEPAGLDVIRATLR